MKRSAVTQTPGEREYTFLDYDAQIALLAEKGLEIPDRARLRSLLETIGYYELVNGYKQLFKDPGSREFRPGTTPEELFALYRFDETLRQLFLRYILRIEIRLRSQLSYAFTAAHGARQEAYLDPGNYTKEPGKKGDVRRLISELKRLASSPSGAAYVAYYQKNYRGVPLWVLFKTVSTGTLVRFFRCAEPQLRRTVTAAYPGLREETALAMLQLLTRFRNVCAHNDCLYACRTEEGIPPMPVLRDVTLPVFAEPEGRYRGNDLFAVLITFSYLLPPEDFDSCSRELLTVTEDFLTRCPAVGRARLFRAMGFPEDWNQLRPAACADERRSRESADRKR